MTVKQEIWDFTKVNFKWLAAAILILVFYFQGCFKRFEPQQPTVHSDTTHTQQVQPIVIMPQYTPQQAGNTSFPIILPPNAQGMIPASTIAALTQQVILLNQRIDSLGKEYYATRTYKDSIQLKDTAGKRVGVVNLEQGVTENRLKYTQPSYQLSFPLTTIHTTITQPYQPKRQIYAGVGIQTSSFTLQTLQQVKLGLLYKDRRDNIIGLAPTYNLPSKQFGAELQVYRLIKFKK